MLVLPVNINIYNKNYRGVQQQSFGSFFRRTRENKDTFVKTSDNNDFVSSRIYGKDVFEAAELSLRKSDKKVPVYISRDEHDDLVSFGIYVKNEGELGGIIIQTPEQAESVCFDSSDFFRKFAKKSMYVDYLYSDNDGYELSKYKGIGTELIKSAVRESIRNGYKGRLILSAANGYASPVPFYYKCGFRFEDEDANKSMEEFLRSKSKNLPSSLSHGIMYLSEEKAKELVGG